MGSSSGKHEQAPVPATLSSQQCWELARRPQGLVSVDDMVLVEREIETSLADGECIVSVELLSVDAFLLPPQGRIDGLGYHCHRRLRFGRLPGALVALRVARPSPYYFLASEATLRGRHAAPRRTFQWYKTRIRACIRVCGVPIPPLLQHPSPVHAPRWGNGFTLSSPEHAPDTSE